jgi:hypothetical protein
MDSAPPDCWQRHKSAGSIQILLTGQHTLPPVQHAPSQQGSPELQQLLVDPSAEVQHVCEPVQQFDPHCV